MNETKQIIIEKEIRERITWIINLRWFAVAGVFAAISMANYVLGIKLPMLPLYLGNIVLLLYNILFFFYNKKLSLQDEGSSWFRKASNFANLQISLDLITLVYLIHFSGGIENPFIFYFIFHMVIASILLSNKAAYLQATLAILFLGMVISAEYLKILPHYHLEGFIPVEACLLSPKHVFGVFSVFVTTLYITIYFATSIVNKLRQEEKELSITNSKLEEQDRLKSQYVLAVSHDLQASLSTIQGCLKVVLSNFADSISKKPKEMIARAEKRTLYMIRYVKDLLNLSKIRAAKELEKQSIILSVEIEKIIEMLKLTVDEKKIKLSIEIPGGNHSVWANPEALEHLLVNLMTNAIRYTPWGGKIGIQVKEKTDSIQTVIWDTGIGIPQEEMSHIFEDFFRAKNAEKMEKDGTGLGLSIVKQIVDEHKGEIWVDSQAGKGSKFTFNLPKGGVTK